MKTSIFKIKYKLIMIMILLQISHMISNWLFQRMFWGHQGEISEEIAYTTHSCCEALVVGSAMIRTRRFRFKMSRITHSKWTERSCKCRILPNLIRMIKVRWTSLWVSATLKGKYRTYSSRVRASIARAQVLEKMALSIIMAKCRGPTKLSQAVDFLLQVCQQVAQLLVALLDQ